jgi:TATA-binding protein-associated factor Taf7
MSEVVARRPRKEQKPNLVELIKEYVDRLQALMERAEKAHSAQRESKLAREELFLLQKHYRRLAPAIKDLSRYVSQLIEHGSVDELVRLELQLRLADLEHGLMAADRMIGLAISQ